MKAAIVTIGDEILLGQIIDTNSVWLTQKLTVLGIDVTEICSISDKEEAIESKVGSLLQKVDIILLTGGLGPTKDDITKKTISEFLDYKLEFDQQLFIRISDYFKKLGIPVTELHRQQCFMPKGARQLQNNMGTAPGMLFMLENRKWIVSMPGVPYEMKSIFSNELMPLLKKHYPEYGNIYYRTIKTAGIGETRLAELIEDISERLPKHISLAFLPSLGHVKLRLTCKSNKKDFPEVDRYTALIAERLKHHVYGFDDISLEKALKRDFTAKNLTLSTAESCTGGYLSHRLTSVPGSSEYFLGSIISYSNTLKQQLLGVPDSSIDKYGAVSEETVLAMLQGALEQTNSDLSVAISGIAGPGGGTIEKPVGTIWMAWGTRKKQMTRKLQLSKDRIKNIEYTSVAAMNSLRLFLTEL
jgi:nicotinamide-nucleotide amidase